MKINCLLLLSFCLLIACQSGNKPQKTTGQSLLFKKAPEGVEASNVKTAKNSIFDVNKYIDPTLPSSEEHKVISECCVMVYGKYDNNYTFELTIEPSFLASKTWTIQRGKDECVFNGMKYPLSKKDALLNSYLSQLDSLLSVFKFNKSTSVVSKKRGVIELTLDGVSTRGRLILPDRVKTFTFHSVTADKDATQEELILTFYNIAFYFYFQSELKNQLTAAEKEYLEKLENAGVGRKPIRLVSSNPLTYRLFDRVYTFSYKPVLELLNGLDKRAPVIIEVGRYYDINQYDEFVRPFKEFLKTRSNIFWIASGEAREQLIAMGLDEKYIFSDKD